VSSLEFKKKLLFQKWKKIEVVLTEQVNCEVKFPEDFTFRSNFENSFEKIKEVNTAIFQFNNIGDTITLDFSKCKKVDNAALFFLQVMRLYLITELRKIYKKFKSQHQSLPMVVIVPSKSSNVNRLLSIMGFMKIRGNFRSYEENDSDFKPINHVGYLRGNRRDNRIRKTGKVTVNTDKIVVYLNKCLNHHGYKFSAEEIANLSVAVTQQTIVNLGNGISQQISLKKYLKKNHCHLLVRLILLS
jgi:hypothetical protein